MEFILLGSNETGSETISEPIEISVVALDAGMIIVQPVELNQVDNNSGSNINQQPINVEINNPTVESSNDAEVTPGRKKRKRYFETINYLHFRIDELFSLCFV